MSLKNIISRFAKQSEITIDIRNILLSEISLNPYQPRTVFDSVKISELASTIKTHGLLQPIIVRSVGTGFELVAGERRLRACNEAGFDRIPAIVREMSDLMSASISLIENLQREQLNPIDEAIAYEQLMKLNHITQEVLAQRLAKSQSAIANKIRLLKLPLSVQDALKQYKITERHARCLLNISDKSLQLKVLNDIIDKELNVKETELLAIHYASEEPKENLSIRKSKTIKVKSVRLAINTIKRSIQMVRDSGTLIDTSEIEHPDYFEILIKIPKKNSSS